MNKVKIMRAALTRQQAAFLKSRIKNFDYQDSAVHGEFSSVTFSADNPLDDKGLLKGLNVISDKICKIEQPFNNIECSKLKPGQYITKHMDNRRTVGTAIFVVVDGTPSVVYDDNKVELKPGDIVLQDCTNGFRMGPNWSIEPVQNETVFTLKMKTVLKNNEIKNEE